MKLFKRSICLLLVLMMVLPVAAFAQEQESQSGTYSLYFMGYDAYLYKTGTTTFQAWFDVDARYGMQELGASEIKIQRSSDGVNFTTMATFTMEDYPNLIDEDTGSHGSYVTYTGTKGYCYRARVTYYAKNYSNGIGEDVNYTANLWL